MKATRIKMKNGCENSSNAIEIAEIFIEDCKEPKFYEKGAIHDYLKTNPNSIQVNIHPYPNLLPVVSVKGEKYVRSEPNDTPHDNLLKLPRC